MISLTSLQVAQLKERLPSLIENEPMQKHTTFHIGGPARTYFVATTSDEAVRAVEAAQELQIPWYVSGGGTNLLVADAGYEGLLIQMTNRVCTIDGLTVHAESGTIFTLLARQTVEAGLSGLEWASGVPGTIGGAIYGNAGCYGGEIGDVIIWVDAFRLSDRTRVKIEVSQCFFGYRDSIFKHEPHVILGCELHLKKSDDVVASKRRMDEIMAERRAKQPIDFPSAGCVFKNAEFHDEQDLAQLREQVDEIPRAMVNSHKLGAGWLIDQAGCTGKAVGAMEVSMKHGNFFVNKGGATADDAIALISLVKMNVRDKLGIELHEEVQYLGFET